MFEWFSYELRYDTVGALSYLMVGKLFTQQCCYIVWMRYEIWFRYALFVDCWHTDSGYSNRNGDKESQELNRNQSQSTTSAGSDDKGVLSCFYCDFLLSLESCSCVRVCAVRAQIRWVSFHCCCAFSLRMVSNECLFSNLESNELIVYERYYYQQLTCSLLTGFFLVWFVYTKRLLTCFRLGSCAHVIFRLWCNVFDTIQCFWFYFYWPDQRQRDW